MSVAPDPATAPPVEPAGAVAALFGERAQVAREFCRHLSTTAVTRGLVGPREVPRLWERHILNCAAITERVPPGSLLVDVGSGAGLPGLVVAIARPDVRVLLVEPLQRRVTWLEEVVADLDLLSVDILRARAEELVPQIRADVVTARAVAALPVLARLCLPLARPGGRFLAVKGRSAVDELESSLAELAALGAVGWEVRVCGEGLLAEPTTVIEAIAGEPRSAAAKRGRSRRGAVDRRGGRGKRP